jgi:hypothetical protein
MPTPPVIDGTIDRALSQGYLGDAAQNLSYWTGQAGNPYGRASSSTGGAVAIAATETLINNIQITPGTNANNTTGTLKVGSLVRATIKGTYTAAAGSAPIFTVRAGTLGTISDAQVGAATLGTSATSGTAIIFNVRIEFNVVTLGASGTVVGDVFAVNSGTTGIFTAATNQTVALATSLAIATTTATYIDISMTAGASNSASITACLIEVLN